MMKLDGRDIRSPEQAQRWTKYVIFPGPGYLSFGTRPPSQPEVSNPDLGLEFFDAQYIESGPFKLTFTPNIDEHLTFNDKRQLRLYCGGRLDVPLFGLLDECHFLAKQASTSFHRLKSFSAFEVSAVEDEIQEQLRLIFTRSRKSLSILINLLGEHDGFLNTYLIDIMIFTKFILQPQSILLKWILKVPAIKKLFGDHVALRQYTNELENRRTGYNKDIRDKIIEMMRASISKTRRSRPQLESDV
jgi:hypothetical protein